MNQSIETILNRRSIRAYSSQPVSNDDLETILSCGDAGPCGGGNRGWRYVVVRDPELKKRLVTLGMPIYRKWLEKTPDSFKARRAELDKSADPIYYNAPVIVFVIGKGMSVDYNCAIVCQNLMLAARSLEIGSCWVQIGQLVLEDEAIRAEFGIVEGEKVFGPVILGYPAKEFPSRPAVPPCPVLWK